MPRDERRGYMNDVMNFPLMKVVVPMALIPITLSKPSTTSPVIVLPFTRVTIIVARKKFLLINLTNGLVKLLV